MTGKTTAPDQHHGMASEVHGGSWDFHSQEQVQALTLLLHTQSQCDQVQTGNFHYPPSGNSVAIRCRQITPTIPQVVGNSVSLFLPTWVASEEAHEDIPGLWLLPSSKEATRTPTLWCWRRPCIKHQWNTPDFQRQWYLQSWVKDGASHLSLEVLKIPSLPWMSIAAKRGKLDFSSFLAVIRSCHPSPLIEQCQRKLTKPGNLCKIQIFTT